jgi:hypothetical protein
VTTFRGGSLLLRYWFFRSGLGFITAMLAFGALMGLLEASPELFAIGSKVLFVALVAVMLSSLVPSQIVVGSDGALVRWLWVREFYPFARIKSVDVYNVKSHMKLGSVDVALTGVVLTMDDGGIARLPVGPGRAADRTPSALKERIDEGRLEHGGGLVEPAAALLERRAATARDWIKHLRALGAGSNADLRTAPVSADRLWRIVESVGADASARAAAAVALVPSLDEGGKQRLRVARKTVADDGLRAAIYAAEREDEEALERAMDEVSRSARSER